MVVEAIFWSAKPVFTLTQALSQTLLDEFMTLAGVSQERLGTPPTTLSARSNLCFLANLAEFGLAWIGQTQGVGSQWRFPA